MFVLVSFRKPTVSVCQGVTLGDLVRGPVSFITSVRLFLCHCPVPVFFSSLRKHRKITLPMVRYTYTVTSMFAALTWSNHILLVSPSVVTGSKRKIIFWIYIVRVSEEEPTRKIKHKPLHFSNFIANLEATKKVLSWHWHIFILKPCHGQQPPAGSGRP